MKNKLPFLPKLPPLTTIKAYALPEYEKYVIVNFDSKRLSSTLYSNVAIKRLINYYDAQKIHALPVVMEHIYILTNPEEVIGLGERPRIADIPFTDTNMSLN